MGRMVYRGAIPAAIGGIAIVLAIAIVGRVGAAGERQTSAPPPSSAGPGPTSPPAQRPTSVRSTARVDYEREIKPILSENCLECHSQDKRKGGLSLATYGDVLDGGRRTARSCGRATGAQHDDREGQGRAGRPDAARRAAVERRADRAAAALDRRGRAGDADLRGGAAAVGGAARAHAPALPAVVWPAWQRPADRFVAAYLSRAGVRQPAPVADAVFARRAYLDIWGLLPSPERCRRSSPTRPRTSATVSLRRCSPTTRSTPSTGSRSGTICSATRTASDLLLGDGRREHHRLADGGA